MLLSEKILSHRKRSVFQGNMPIDIDSASTRTPTLTFQILKKGLFVLFLNFIFLLGRDTHIATIEATIGNVNQLTYAKK